MTNPAPYSLRLTGNASNDLARLDKTTAKRIGKALRRLAENAEAVRHTALSGQWRGLYRLRVGDYRVIYALNHETREIVVEVIGHRRDVYEEK